MTRDYKNIEYNRISNNHDIQQYNNKLNENNIGSMITIFSYHKK